MTVWCVVEQYIPISGTPSSVVDRYFLSMEEAVLYAKMKNWEASEDLLLEGEWHWYVEQAQDF